ncbi:hypothetical protein Plec18170_009588 [Paecilomyces lecythidis]
MFSFAKRTLSSITSQDDDDFPDADFADREDTPETLEEKQRQELYRRIIDLWKTVWLGLYQRHDNKGQYHSDRLRALYLGAGMSTRMVNYDPDADDADNAKNPVGLGLLGVALSQQFHAHNGLGGGFSGLKLYDGLSLRTLESVIEILEAYEREIEPLGEVYAVLRRLQVGLREPTTDDEEAVMQNYPPVADPIARRLLQYNATLDVLAMQIYDEMTALYDDPKLRIGWLVQDEVFPRIRRQGSSSMGVFKSGR